MPRGKYGCGYDCHQVCNVYLGDWITHLITRCCCLQRITESTVFEGTLLELICCPGQSNDEFRQHLESRFVLQYRDAVAAQCIWSGFTLTTKCVALVSQEQHLLGDSVSKNFKSWADLCILWRDMPQWHYWYCLRESEQICPPLDTLDRQKHYRYCIDLEDLLLLSLF